MCRVNNPQLLLSQRRQWELRRCGVRLMVILFIYLMVGGIWPTGGGVGHIYACSRARCMDVVTPLNNYLSPTCLVLCDLVSITIFLVTLNLLFGPRLNKLVAEACWIRVSPIFSRGFCP